MLKPRKLNNYKEYYFTTNTSSNRVKQYLNNSKASVYFYNRGLFSYQGVMLIGNIEVLTDHNSKEMIWQENDTKYYKKGLDNPDYCVLKFTASKLRYYKDFKTL